MCTTNDQQERGIVVETRTDHDDVGSLAASINRQAFDAGIVLIELSPIRTTLEDRYLTMVSGGAQ